MPAHFEILLSIARRQVFYDDGKGGTVREVGSWQ